jgi:DTW domain-containing protein YfiP
VRPTANAVEVRVLQHPDEAGQAKGSLTLLARSLQRCEVRIGETFGTPPDAGAEGRTALLYPVTEVAPGPLAAPGWRPQRLVVLDATWRKSLRLLQLDPALQALPRWPLPAPPPSLYASLRRAARPGQRSTLEATCLALADIEADAGRYAPLLQAFAGWVEAQAAWFRPSPRPAPATGPRRPRRHAGRSRPVPGR